MGYKKRRPFRTLVKFMLAIFIIILAFNYLKPRDYMYDQSFDTSFLSDIGSVLDFRNKDYKSDDKDELLRNIKTVAMTGNDKASWIYDNADSLPDVCIYLAGNDPATIDFVYNYRNGLTDFEYFPGESVELNRQTPYFIQWDNRWAYDSLGASNVGIAGCGPTSMAMVLARLNNDKTLTPEKISRDAASYMTADGISWQFFYDEAAAYGYTATDIANDKAAMVEALDYGPLIVSVDRGYFTLFGHILVIDSYENGKFIINDPNSLEKSQKSWTYRQLEDQISHIWLIS